MRALHIISFSYIQGVGESSSGAASSESNIGSETSNSVDESVNVFEFMGRIIYIV